MYTCYLLGVRTIDPTQLANLDTGFEWNFYLIYSEHFQKKYLTVFASSFVTVIRLILNPAWGFREPREWEAKQGVGSRAGNSLRSREQRK